MKFNKMLEKIMVAGMLMCIIAMIAKFQSLFWFFWCWGSLFIFLHYLEELTKGLRRAFVLKIRKRFWKRKNWLQIFHSILLLFVEKAPKKPPLFIDRLVTKKELLQRLRIHFNSCLIAIGILGLWGLGMFLSIEIINQEEEIWIEFLWFCSFIGWALILGGFLLTLLQVTEWNGKVMDQDVNDFSLKNMAVYMSYRGDGFEARVPVGEGSYQGGAYVEQFQDFSQGSEFPITDDEYETHNLNLNNSYLINPHGLWNRLSDEQKRQVLKESSDRFAKKLRKLRSISRFKAFLMGIEIEVASRELLDLTKSQDALGGESFLTFMLDLAGVRGQYQASLRKANDNIRIHIYTKYGYLIIIEREHSELTRDIKYKIKLSCSVFKKE